MTKRFWQHPFVHNLFCASFITAVFSLRWRNCLPFSGRMPVLNDIDSIPIWGKHLLYVQEAFGWPIGIVQSLGFPCKIASISNSTIPLVSIPIKLVSKIIPALGEFYYLISVELASVFVTAFFACRLLELYGRNGFALKFLASALVGLSVPFLYRVSVYYQMTWFSVFFPVFLVGAYLYLRAARDVQWKTLVPFALLFPAATLTDPYCAFSVSFIGAGCVALHVLEALLRRERLAVRRAIGIGAAFLIGTVLAYGVSLAVADQSRLKAPTRSLMKGRDATGWAYGGGYGGGFHGADVLSVVMPPEARADLPTWKNFGPDALLTSLKFPVTTADFQDGQYEGFAYTGSVAVLLLLLALVLLWKRKGSAQPFRKTVFEPHVVLGISVFALYVLSWGYIVHLGGTRFNDVPTPALVLAKLWPRFMYARALGRFALPFALFVAAAAVFAWARLAQAVTERSARWRQLMSLVAIALAFAHVYEIRGFLTPPAEIVEGNDIALSLSIEDQKRLKAFVSGKKAILATPVSRANPQWCKTYYAIAYHSGVPMSGPDTTFGVPEWASKVFREDLKTLEAGDVKALVSRYGDIAIAAPKAVAAQIESKSNIKLMRLDLESADAALLTPPF